MGKEMPSHFDGWALFYLGPKCIRRLSANLAASHLGLMDYNPTQAR